MMQQSQQVVHVIPAGTARTLIARGLVRATEIQPMPIDGVAVNLTVLGKGWQPRTVKGEQPVDVAETDQASSVKQPQPPIS
jgi:hypothetical protein